MEAMEKVVIKADRREVTGKKVRALRREGKLPAVLYGYRFEPTPITLDKKSASRILHHVTSSSLVTIELDGKEHATLVRDKQRDFILGNLTHVDFMVVSMTETLRAMVGIEISGSAPAVKDHNGVLITGVTELEVECLPQDLPERVVVDLSNLKEIGDGVHVSDIHLSEKVRVLNDPEEMVVIITTLAAEEVEEKVLVEVEAGKEPEVIERGKREEDEGEK